MIGIIIVLVLLLAGCIAYRAWSRRQDARRRDDARREDAAAVEQARERQRQADAAADAQRAEDEKRRPVDVFNDVVRRRGGPLCLAAALLLSLQARAQCVEDAASGAVTCTREAAEALKDELLDLRQALTKAKAATTRVEKERDAARARIAVLEQLPPPEMQRPWLWAAGGVGVGLTLALALVAVAR